MFEEVTFRAESSKKKNNLKKCIIFQEIEILISIFQEMELFSPQKLNPLNKARLGESGCLSNLYLLAAEASSFLIYLLFRTRPVRPHFVASTSLCSSCVTYGLLFHPIGHQGHQIFWPCASAHIANLFPTKQDN